MTPLHLDRLLTYLFNLSFYLAPYIFMIFHRLNPSPRKLLLPFSAASFFIGVVFYQRYHYAKVAGGSFNAFHYLVGLYLSFWIISSLLSLRRHSVSQALAVGFMISYITSFYWELPQNILSILEMGWHSAILLHLLGVFPLIWLIKITKFKLTIEKVIFILIGLFASSIIILAEGSPNNVVWTPITLEAVNFLLNRVICFNILVYVFLFNSVKRRDKDG